MVASLPDTPDKVMQQMLQAGVHFGHQAKRWNPKMKPYIHSTRNGIHVIDLDQTLGYLGDALEFIKQTTANGGKILFVGTKKQAQEVIAADAARSGQFFINRRWLGGTLTNFATIRGRLKLMKDIERQDERGDLELLPKQEAANLRQELERLQRTLGGMRDMTQLPAALFVIDPKREHLAMAEAQKLKIPVIAITDTNADPDQIEYLIPGNDDAIRAVRLLTGMVADAAIQGMMENQAYRADEALASEAVLADEPGVLDADLFAAAAVEEAVDEAAAEVTP
ncbi:MAG TPA: 30S ribosomal protein S2 [Thermomicrobiales bacterium]|nr:30S ribosomal protein S2 [Thermomicrobiales bacterium]